jgi:uncharacterized protein YqeY
MSLKNRIDEDIKVAMRNKDKDQLRALRSIKSMILLAETEKGAQEELAEEAEMRLLTKAANQRRESLSLFREQGREDLAEKEEAELQVIERYLPKQLSEAELQAEVQKIIAETGAQGPQDMGKVMGVASKALAGRADGKLVAALVREQLAAKS